MLKVSKAEKKIFAYITIFAIAIGIVLVFLVVKNGNTTDEPVSRVQAMGYTLGESETEEVVTTAETTVTTEATTTTTEVTTAETEPIETTIVTTEPLNETVIDHSNISRATLPSAHCQEVANLKQTNSDTRGWVSISNTNISYAFTQGLDNSYYLTHDFYKNESHSGWVFMDYMGTFDDDGQQSDLITLYGHNMADGSMFATLKKYRDNADFYQANPIITLSSVNGYKYYKIFAYMVCNGSSSSDFKFWNYSDLSDPNTFYYYVNSAFNKSKIITGVDVQYGDKILALSTCNSGSSSNTDRFVVLARMVRDGEDIYEGCYRVR
jgi:SrtB family sortase